MYFGVITGLPHAGKKFWKMKKIPGQGKVGEFHNSQGNLEKNKKKFSKFSNKVAS